MKAKLVQRHVYDRMVGFIHGMGYNLTYIVFESINVGITIDNGNLVVFVDFHKDPDDRILSEIEVSDVIFDLAAEYAIARKRLIKLQDQIKELLR